jgi:hypothetical protein
MDKSPTSTLNWNIALLPPLPPNSYGFNPCFAILESFSLHRLLYGLTTLVPRTLLQILPSILVSSRSKLIFISFVTKSPPKHLLSASSPTKITKSTSLPNQPLLSPPCVPSSMQCASCLACRGIMNKSNSINPFCVIPKMKCLLKSLFDQNSIMINHKFNGDLKSYIIIRRTQDQSCSITQ